MDISTYEIKTAGLLKNLDTPTDDLAHMAMGLAGEAGEVLDEVKKHFAYGRQLNRDKVIEELGDCMFYANGLCQFLDLSLGDVLDINIKKLEARYPDLRFDAERANNRDVVAEAAAMKR